MKATLDTTYLLPLFGVDIDLPNFTVEFQELLGSAIAINVSSVSVFEIKGKIAREVRRGMADLAPRFKAGLRSLLLSGRFHIVEYNVDIDDIVDDLSEAGLDDLFDCAIAATAIYGSDLLVTEDEGIVTAIRRTDHKAFPVMGWSGFRDKALK